MRLLVALLSVAVAACSQAPLLKLPDVPVAAEFKERGTAAKPTGELPREAWWTLFNDAELDRLQQRLIARSPDLAAALARYQQSKAATDLVRASQLPSLGASLNVQRDRQSEQRPLRVLGPHSPNYYESNTLGVQLDYELDLWGRVRSQVAASVQLDQAAQADLAAARLLLQAQLADSYIALRGLDREALLLRDTETAYGRALDLINRRHQGGIASGLDVARAEAQIAATRSQMRQSMAQRALLEHAIAALVGEAASDFKLAPQTSEITLPAIPAGVPSALLQRRPDIAAAERRVAASNASVGVAQAAFFPAVTLSALAGFQTGDIGSFIRAPNLFWAVGPTLALSLFDGGRRDAEVARVKAVLDESGEKYRSAVIGAFQQVEDNLALLDHYGAAAESERAAVKAAQRSLDIASARYREGAANYLEVVSSQTATLQAQRSALDLGNRQRRAAVQLVRALGGGWGAGSGATATQ